jgi:ABC-type uncharacterized transport system permease subunit
MATRAGWHEPMESLATVMFIFGVVAYSVAATLYFVDLARPERISLALPTAFRAQLVGTLLHLGHLVTTSFLSNICPVESLPFALSLSAVVMSGAYLLMGRRLGLGALGVAVAPIALTFLVAAQFVGRANAPQGLPRTVLMLHITSNLLGFALFLLAGAAGAFYLFQERRLKFKHRPVSGRLPALDLLDTAEHRLLLAGFPLLTFGVVTGVIFLSGAHEMSGPEMLRAGLAYVSWALVAGVLVLRALAGWRGRRTAYGTLAGVVCVLLLVAAYVVRAAGVFAA